MMTDAEAVETLSGFRARCAADFAAAEKEEHEASMALRRAIKRMRAAREARQFSARVLKDFTDACNSCGRLAQFCRCR